MLLEPVLQVLLDHKVQLGQLGHRARWVLQETQDKSEQLDRKGARGQPGLRVPQGHRVHKGLLVLREFLD